MRSRLLAGVAAIVLAVVGAFLVYSYAQKADARAMAGLETRTVLVVQEPIPAGTSSASLGEFLTIEQLPAAAVPKAALRDLSNVSGKVTAVDLVPGEQLLAKRLIDPREARSANSVDVPKGLQEVSFELEPQRVVGGVVSAGDHVGVLVSFEEGASETEPDVPTTQFVFHKVLVTNVQGAPGPNTESTAGEGEALPEGSLIITVAVNDVDAADIVFASEFGTIWLTKEPKSASVSDPSVATKTEVYK